MRKNTMPMAAAVASILGSGVARATVDMQIETERDRRKKAFLDNECAATGQTCAMGPHEPDGTIQCRYCGKESAMATADYSEIERRVLAHNPALSTAYGVNPAVALAELSNQPVNEELKLYCEQDAAIFGVNYLSYIYAQAAAEIMKPGPDEPLPDRFSVNPENPAYDKRWASVKIGIRFDGRDRPGDVEEYCISGGWIRIHTFLKNGKVRRERGKILCVKLHGKVEPYRK